MPRKVEVEFDERSLVAAEGLSRALNYLARHEADSHDLEDILNASIQSHYEARPNGDKRYGGESPSIGKVSLCRFNAHKAGEANLEYAPSFNLSRLTGGIVSRTIGKVNLKARTYTPNWSDNDFERYQLLTILVRDTEEVMKALGLTRKDRE